MWQKNTRAVIIKAVLLVLSLALLAGLAFAVKKVRSREEEQDAQLLELYNQQQAQQQQARQANLDEVTAAYERDVQTVATYLPGIVCWGDVLTGGTAGGVSYPSELQSLLDRNLCGRYDFRSTVKNADDFNNRLDWDSFTVEIPVVNMGTGRESADTVLGRSGAVPFAVSAAFEIPADCQSVPVRLCSSNGSSVAPLGQSDVGVNDVTIAGITGKLTVDMGFTYSDPRYIFTRNEPGNPVAVEAGEPVLVSCADRYLDYLPVIFVGSFGGYSSPDELVSKIRSLIDRQNNPERYVVIGTYYQGTPEQGWLLGASTAAALESAMAQAFGEHYINLRKYLANDCLTDLDLKPAKDDTNYMKRGMVPPALLNKENNTELIPAAYECLGRLVYEKMTSLGYFNEIVEELEIAGFGKENPDAK